MSQKNETVPLILALLITLGLLGVAGWWLLKSSQVQQILNPGSSPTPANPNNPASPNPNPRTSPSLPPAPIPQSSENSPAFDQVANIPAGVFNYGGSTTWAPIRRDVDSVIQQEIPQFSLRYIEHPTKPPGSGTGIGMLLDNQLAFSQSSRSLKTEEYQVAEQRGFTLKETPVAIDGIAVAVNPTLDISGMTIAQLQDIYTGKITNWSELGGPDLLIQPYSRRIEDGGTIEFFVDNILDGEAFGANVEFIPTTTQALRQVSQNLGGIYYASAPEVVDQCTIKPLPVGSKPDQLVPPYQEPFVPPEACPAQRNQLNASAFRTGEYPITRRLFVIIKQNGQVDQQAGETYANLLLTEQGQALIEETGFVRIR
ncbi:MAG: PstS family phosphate ABC transporter substrate-binding protein [Oscillatoriales cyanobacterium RM2_1_1]|nr:PstS family phosphate ABC transporter substrate-binding protein [Oscillatoriales cyanobacterium SM2_3_0]NJO45802.1 PstS family phosphate ABC transporter substrate-binding protein [Oscillatoriales cyanobacterium RM2_1_1]